MRVSDGMNRREIKNVEAHFSDFGDDNPLAIFERAAGSRKHFVPRTEARANRVDGNSQLPVMRDPGSLRIFRRERSETLIDLFYSEIPSCVLELLRIGSHRTLTGGV